MKKNINILLLIFLIGVVLIFTSNKFSYECPFKMLFGMCCPSCGLTRSFRAIYDFDFLGSFNYNILGIPLFIVGIIICFSLVIDIIRDRNNTIRYIFMFLNKYYLFVFLLLIITTILKNVRDI